MPDYSRDFLGFDLDTTIERDEDYQTREDKAHASSVVEGLLAASQIFIYAALRELPTNAKIFHILVDRLRVALARPSVCNMHVWKKEGNLNMLLWTVTVGCSVAAPGEGRAWWIRNLVEIMIKLDIKTRFDLEMAMQNVAWVDTYFSSVLGGIWEEASQQCRAKVKGHCRAMVDQPLSRPVDATLLGERMWEAQIGGDFGERDVNYDGAGWNVDGWFV